MSYATNVPFDYIPDYGASKKQEISRSVSNFGDGYAQAINIGLNPVVRTWSLTFTGDIPIIDEIETVLMSTNSVGTLLWTPPIGKAGKWVFKKYIRLVESPAVDKITVDFEEVFEA